MAALGLAGEAVWLSVFGLAGAGLAEADVWRPLWRSVVRSYWRVLCVVGDVLCIVCYV